MQTFHEISEKLSRSISVKIAIIGFLILILLIPAFFIQGLISDRQRTRDSVVQEVSDKWGRSQTVSGPVLAIPYFELHQTGDGEILKSSKTLFVLPKKLDIMGNMNPEIRHRSIYKVIVYKSDLNFNGIFHMPDLDELGIVAEQVSWDKASVLFGISDLRGIQNQIGITLNDRKFAVEPGIKYSSYAASGFTSYVKLNPDKKEYHLKLDLNLSGSENLYFSPIGKTTEVNIKSSWSSPSFSGSFLPDEHHINKSGFEAKWTILDLNRNFPQLWNNQTYPVENAAFGVNLLFPVDEYQKSMRSAKYAFMFIALTFLIYLFVEFTNKKRIHPVQYLLVSFALLLFYTLLLSLSEQIGFNLAYLISAVITIGLITVYSHTIFKAGKLTRIVAFSLIALYAFLFTILQLEDYALLFGSVGLFIILGFVMYLSKRINWYGQINGGMQLKET